MIPTAVTWYESEADYKAMLEVIAFDDPQGAISYAALVARTERFEKELPQMGQLPVRVTVKPLAFKAWCESHGRPVIKDSVGLYTMSLLGDSLKERGSN